jgi:glutamate 5-kinase
MTDLAPEHLSGARLVVVKVGSSLVVDAESGAADAAWLGALAADLGRLKARGQKALIVSSGAVALGRRRLALKRRALTLPEKQAAAAAGQSLLMQAWEAAMAPAGLIAAQVLMTPDDTEVRRRYLNARATLETLLELGVTPVVNENGWPRVSPRWWARTSWCCSPTSTGSTPPIRAATRARSTFRTWRR